MEESASSNSLDTSTGGALAMPRLWQVPVLLKGWLNLMASNEEVRHFWRLILAVVMTLTTFIALLLAFFVISTWTQLFLFLLILSAALFGFCIILITVPVLPPTKSPDVKEALPTIAILEQEQPLATTQSTHVREPDPEPEPEAVHPKSDTQGIAIALTTRDPNDEGDDII
jgi:hypothetical protein